MKERLKGLNGVSIGLIIASMVLFPHGLLSDNIVIAIIGWVCLFAGVVIGRIGDRRKQTAVTKS